MNKHLFYYGPVGNGPEFDIESTWNIEDDRLDRVVEECAENYDKDHDGWEDQWPVQIELYDSNKKLLGIFEVEKEFDPVFHATFKDEPKAE